MQVVIKSTSAWFKKFKMNDMLYIFTFGERLNIFNHYLGFLTQLGIIMPFGIKPL